MCDTPSEFRADWTTLAFWPKSSLTARRTDFGLIFYNPDKSGSKLKTALTPSVVDRSRSSFHQWSGLQCVTHPTSFRQIGQLWLFGRNPPAQLDGLIVAEKYAGLNKQQMETDSTVANGFLGFKIMEHRWFSGRMLACHAGGPGSIPGRCSIVFRNWKRKFLEVPGIDPGTSRMLSERSTI